MNAKWASLTALVILVMAVVTLMARDSLFASGVVAIGVQPCAVLLMVWARLTFGMRSFHASANPTEGGLMTSGPYRFLRHPIYAAIFYFVGAGVASHATAVNASLAAIATVAIAVRIAAEERLLVERYPEYVSYAARTKRVIPFVL